MSSKIFFATFLLLTVYHQSVDCAMKKSWKSAANFETDVPKFTPFETEDSPASIADAHLNEVPVKTTETPMSPLPSAESLISKISSKIRIPPKHIAEIYNQLHQDMQNDAIESGSVEASAERFEAPEEDVKPIKLEPENEPYNIQQILNELSEEADKGSSNEAINSILETDVELDISSIASDVNKTQYKVGPLMNLTIDSEDNLVNVNLDQNTLKEIFTGSRSESIHEATIKHHKLNFYFSFLTTSQAGVKSITYWSESFHCLFCRSSSNRLSFHSWLQ